MCIRSRKNKARARIQWTTSVAPSHSWKSCLQVQGLSKSDLTRVQGLSKSDLTRVQGLSKSDLTRVQGLSESDLSKEGKGPITLWVHLEIQRPWGHWDIPRWTRVRVILFKHFGPCHLAEQKSILLPLFQQVKYDARTVFWHLETLPKNLGPQGCRLRDRASRIGWGPGQTSRNQVLYPKRHFSELSNFWKEI